MRRNRIRSFFDFERYRTDIRPTTHSRFGDEKISVESRDLSKSGEGGGIYTRTSPIRVSPRRTSHCEAARARRRSFYNVITIDVIIMIRCSYYSNPACGVTSVLIQTIGRPFQLREWISTTVLVGTAFDIYLIARLSR